jgi:hypothetical protein
MNITNIQHHTNTQFEIITFENLYNDEEIKAHLNFINDAKFDKKFTNNNFKNGKIINDSLSNAIFNKIKLILPEIYIDSNNQKWKIIGATKYVFYANYRENESFGIHTDTGSVFEPNYNLYSKFTLLTYLNDNYEGGETIFYANNLVKTNKIIPKTNKTVIFDINLFHKSNIVLNGHKYWIGTEIVCEKL